MTVLEFRKVPARRERQSGQASGMASVGRTGADSSSEHAVRPHRPDGPRRWRTVYSAPRVRSDSFSFCRPSASKFAGSSQRSKAARSRGHSPSMIENQAVSRLRPL